ncbi:hypothetical protein [Massilia sp. CF038]|uniref:hypothetical protein n=1 Tax=Massilia sp. CF038 TaxID=1881045 RepID=UPI000921152B|nr:hypothetical protein [Massilia sp. CF038]SHG71631.1 hypothetical protein SAMN05428948_1739 [Massilia sp. CF038]
MPTKTIDQYLVEFIAEQLKGTEEWGAFVAISMPSDNPMHMTSVFAKQRVAADHTFADQHEAETEAERAVAAILDGLRT